VVANRLLARPGLRLILPTGRTPLGMYAALRGLAADGRLVSERATLFQLDEYRGLGPDDPRSFRDCLRRELTGVRFARIHGLDGAVADADAMCARNQALLDEAPVGLAVLGLGRDGHVAFDEPGSPADAGVRRVALQESTRADAAGQFGGERAVPLEALTVGLRTLLAARELLLLVTGDAKSEALRAMLEGPKGPDCPASLLRDHPRLTILCDGHAVRRLRSRPSWTSDRAVIVLGHREPGSAETRVSDESRARLARAERACRADPPRLVVLTGHSRTRAGLSEAEQMQELWAPPDAPPLMEMAGRNTAENATCSLPLIEAIPEVRRVTVVSSAWHVRVPYFFAPYRERGLGLSFARDWTGPFVRPLLGELGALPAMRRQRRLAFAAAAEPPSATRRP
jgi:glucosamine-6-phosphate deaminase